MMLKKNTSYILSEKIKHERIKTALRLLLFSAVYKPFKKIFMSLSYVLHLKK